MSVLDCLYNAVSQILRKNVDKKALFDNLEVSEFGSVGSVGFWASRIRKSRVRIRVIPSSSKNSKKNLDFYCFVTSL
jgi:hypothetical protein